MKPAVEWISRPSLPRELLQPSSVDVRVDRYFRVFRNSRYPFIDVKQEQEDLTEMVEIGASGSSRSESVT